MHQRVQTSMKRFRYAARYAAAIAISPIAERSHGAELANVMLIMFAKPRLAIAMANLSSGLRWKAASKTY